MHHPVRKRVHNVPGGSLQQALQRTPVAFAMLGDNITAITETNTVTSSDASMENIVKWIYMIYTPLLFVFGNVGNLISFFVFSKSFLRSKTRSIYFKTLAISDITYLCILLVRWLYVLKISTLFCMPIVNVVFVYLLHVTNSISKWCVIIYCSERLVAVIYPMKLQLIFTLKRAKYITAALILTSKLVNIPAIKLALTKNDCYIYTKYFEEASPFNTMDTVFSLTIPMVTITILNVATVVALSRSGRIRNQIINPGGEQFRSLAYKTRSISMLLLVSAVFVVLHLPTYALRTAFMYKLVDVHTSRWTSYQLLAQLLVDTSFGINFYLYCLSGQNFRNAFHETVTLLSDCWKGKVPQRSDNICMQEMRRAISETDAVNRRLTPTQRAHEFDEATLDDITPVDNRVAMGEQASIARSESGEAQCESYV